MRKLGISSVVILFVLMAAWPAFGQSAEADGQRERLEGMRQKWQNMSEEEKEKYRARMQNRAGSRGMGREGQLKAIAVIEEQVAKLKAAVENMGQGWDQYQSMSEEERIKFREKMSKVAEARQKAITAIEQQLARLRFRRQRQQPAEAPTRISELQEIHQLAIKEKATETAKRLEGFIARYQQRQSQMQGKEQRPREGQEERTLRERQSRPQENQ